MARNYGYLSSNKWTIIMFFLHAPVKTQYQKILVIRTISLAKMKLGFVCACTKTSTKVVPKNFARSRRPFWWRHVIKQYMQYWKLRELDQNVWLCNQCRARWRPSHGQYWVIYIYIYIYICVCQIVSQLMKVEWCIYTSVNSDNGMSPVWRQDIF